LTDSQLLTHFLREQDEDAFAALVRRHGPMVLGVCRRILRNTCDAEDAFQATFLVFARKAGSLASHSSLGSWLYRIAYRAALKDRARIARRRSKELQVNDMPHPAVAPEDGWRDWLPLLDRELERLPEKYQGPIVLCELEGHSRMNAAAQLGIPSGTLSSRLARGKQLLARRLARHGEALSVGALTVLLAEEAQSAAVPPLLLAATTRAAARQTLVAGMVSAQVAALTEGVLKAMLLSKLKVCGAVVALVVSAGAVGLTYRPAAAQPTPDVSSARRSLADELEELCLEVAALRKGLEVTRDQVKSLRTEMAALRGAASSGSSTSSNAPAATSGSSTGLDAVADQYRGDLKARLDSNVPLQLGLFFHSPRDPVAEAWSALARLQQHPDDKEAADALERAVRRLKERAQPKTLQSNQQ
jgi:RNA polymerase sigma factor (sigma-70 family)